MRRRRTAPVVIAAATALVLAACADDTERPTDDPVDDAAVGDDPAADGGLSDDPMDDAVGDGDADGIEGDGGDDQPAADDMVGGEGPFGLAFEGLWRFDGPREAAVLLAADADPDAVADDLTAEDGVTDVEVADPDVVADRGDFELLLPPDEGDPTVLTVTVEDHDAAAGLENADAADDVEFAFAPTCGALAGTARHHGVDEATAWLDDAGCAEVAVLDADADDAEPWVAAAAVEDAEPCLATAAPEVAMSMCHESVDTLDTQPSTHAGGFVVGFAPATAASVEVGDGSESVTVDTVTVDGEVTAYGVRLPWAEPDPDTGMVEAPDTSQVEVTFLDADGGVVEG